jgi:hypothetical protein
LKANAYIYWREHVSITLYDVAAFSPLLSFLVVTHLWCFECPGPF